MSCGPYYLIFCTPFDLDTKAVDLATGRWGYGHVALWAGQMTKPPEGQAEPLVLDSGIGVGVSFRTLTAMAKGAPVRKHLLCAPLGEWIFLRALEHVGKPYDYTGLLASRPSEDAYTCSGLICCAMPEHMSKEARPRGRPVSPNDLARYFGVPKWAPSH